MKKLSRILIVRTDRIGDVVLTLPLAGIIKKHYPEVKVSFLVREYTKPLTLNNPAIDEIITLEEIRDNFISEIRSRKFDAAVVVYPTSKLAFDLFFSGIKTRIGTGYRWYSFLFNKKIFQHRKYAEKHELEFNVDLLSDLGISEKVSIENVEYNLHPGENSIHKIEALLEQKNVKKEQKTVIIHPGSGGSAMDLPIEKLTQITKLLAQQLDINVIITGADTEKALCERFVLDNKIVNLAGCFDLGGLMALISKADLLIANSTGPIHIAAALGKYVIGFYPKIVSCSPERWAPYTVKRKIFQPGIECSNCTRKQCEELNCMNSINVNEVVESVKKNLNE